MHKGYVVFQITFTDLSQTSRTTPELVLKGPNYSIDMIHDIMKCSAVPIFFDLNLQVGDSGNQDLGYRSLYT